MYQENDTNIPTDYDVNQSHSNSVITADAEQPIKKSAAYLSNTSAFSDHLINELEANLQAELDVYFKNLIRQNLNDYELFNQRKYEEKDIIINQLKENLLNLTEKRFRTAVANSENTDITKEPTILSNIDTLLNEKEARISALTNEILENQQEISNLKRTIKDQDDIILSHNNNIYELKNNHETVLKAKQESFRFMNEDLTRKNKLIEDQNQVIKSLKDKIEQLEEQFSQSRVDFEQCLSEKQNELQVKIAMFEANLHEGRQYFEEMLNEKDNLLKEKTHELNLLKSNASDASEVNNSQLDNSAPSASASMLDSTEAIQKFDDQNMKNMKSLYEHQIDLLKKKIEMLEKTCENYKQGIKEMNKSFGYQQQNDEMASIQVFKDIMQQLQKTNVQLETERIDLQVKVSKLKEELDNARIEKENLNKKFQIADQLSQKLQSERNDVDNNYRQQLDFKQNEINNLSNNVYILQVELERVNTENTRLQQISDEHDQLKQSHEQLTHHYEQLYNQATDIVNGNQLLNEQVEQGRNEIENLQQQLSDLNLKVDHLEQRNSELNTQKINLDMQVSSQQEKLAILSNDLYELNILRAAKLNVDKAVTQLKEIEAELSEKNELIEQLNQAKEFLAENNSKLLTNNIKIQLFIESLGLDLSQLESNTTVKEYEDLREKYMQVNQELYELKRAHQQLKVSQQIAVDKEKEKDKELSNINSILQEKQEKLEKLLESITIPDKRDVEIQANDTKEIEELTDILNSAQNEVELLKNNLKEQINLYDSLNKESIQLKSQLEKLETEKSQSNDTEETLQSLVNFGGNLAARELHDHTISQLSLLSQDMSLFIMFNQEKIDQLNQKLSKLNVDYTELLNENQLNKDKVEKLNALLELSKLEKNGEINTDESELRRLNELVVEKDIKIENLKAEIQTLKDSTNSANTSDSENNSLAYLSQMDSLLAQIDPLKEALNIKVNEIDTLNEKLNQKTNELQSLMTEFDTVQNDMADIYKKNEELNTEIDRLNKKCYELTDELEGSKKKYDQLRVKAHLMKEKIKKNEKDNQKEKSVSPTVSPKGSQEGNQLVEHLFHNLQAEYKEFKEQHNKEISDIHSSYTEQIRTYEENFNALQNEKDSLVGELEDLKANLEKQTSKISQLEQQNLKYKAKLKQLLAKNKQAHHEEKTEAIHVQSEPTNQSLSILIAADHEDLRSSSSTPTYMSNSPIPNKVLENSTSQTDLNLIHYDNLINDLDRQKETISVLSEEKNALYEKLNRVEFQLSQSIFNLENTNNELSQFKISASESEARSKELLNALNHEKTGLLERVSVYEAELDNSLKTLEETKAKKEQEIESIKSTLETTQQQNLKLKAKLKQVLAKTKQQQQQQHQQSSEVEKVESVHLQSEAPHHNLLISTDHDDFRSRSATPTLIASPSATKVFESSLTQTELTSEQIQNLMNDLKSQNESNSQLLEEKKVLSDRISCLESELIVSNKRLEELNNEINDLKSIKVDQENSVKNEEELKSLKSTLETTQQQNLKLKAKLKQFIAKDKANSLKNASVSSTSSSSLCSEALHDEKQTQTDHIPNTEIPNNEVEQKNIEILELNKKISDKNLEIDRLNDEFFLIQKELQEAKIEIDNLKQNLNDKQEKIGIIDQLAGEIETLKVSCSNYEAMITSLNQENAKLLNDMIDRSEVELRDAEITRLKTELDRIKTENVTITSQVNNDLINQYQVQIDSRNLKIDSLSQEVANLKSELDSIRNEKSLFENRIKNLTEFENLIDLKQKMNDSLLTELNEVKNMIETQRVNYEKQLNELTRINNEKENRIIELTSELLTYKTLVNNSIIKNEDHHINSNESLNSNNSSEMTGLDENGKLVYTIKAKNNNNNNNLENQLKYCHEKCEKVVAKLVQLKKQNESLNNKIKSFKSTLYV